MTRHGNLDLDALCVDVGEDLDQFFSSYLSLGSATVAGILKIEQTLANRITVGHLAIIHERDVTHTPTDQIAS